MSGHGVFSTNILYKANGEPKCTNCGREGQDDDAGTPCLSVQHFNSIGKTRWPSYEMGEQSLTTDSLVSIMLRSRRMGPGGCLYQFDNAPQNENRAGAVKALNSHDNLQLMLELCPDAGP